MTYETTAYDLLKDGVTHPIECQKIAADQLRWRVTLVDESGCPRLYGGVICAVDGVLGGDLDRYIDKQVDSAINKKIFL